MLNEFDHECHDINLLVPRDKVKTTNKKKKPKKKKKDHDDILYDYSDINYGGDIRKLMDQFADSIEGYVDSVNTYFIFEGINKEEWKKMKKQAKKLIRKLREGDPSVFDINVLNEVLASDHSIIVGYR